MRRGSRYSFDLEDGFEGAVDVVFLLIIFFLVASSFDKTVREKLQLPARDAEQAVATSDASHQRLNITVLRDSRILVDHQPLAIDDPTSVDAYRMLGQAIENWSAEHFPEETFEQAAPRIDVYITTDRESYAGAALNAIMACLDRGVTPQVIFEQERAVDR